MKKFLAFILIAIMVISCCACSNQQNNTKPVETIPLIPATHHAASYRVNEWRVEGTRDYYTVLATYSADFYDQITAEDVLYLDETYKPLTEIFEGAEIEVFNVSNADTGIGAYVKIHTNRLIDLQKVFIVTEGPETHIDGVVTKDDFIAKGNDAANWIKFYTSISSKQAPFGDIAGLNSAENIGILTGSDVRAYCDATDYEVTRENDKITVKFPYVLFTETDEEAINTMLSTAFTFAADKNGIVEPIYPPEEVEVIGTFDDNYFYVTIRATAEKAIDEYGLEYLVNTSSANIKFNIKAE